MGPDTHNAPGIKVPWYARTIATSSNGAGMFAIGRAPFGLEHKDET